MDRYLICSDIDGTLMTNQQTLSAQTCQLIQSLLDQGHLFYVATGRMYLSAVKIAENINPKVGVIASNGGIFSLNDQIIQYTLQQESSLIIYQLAQKYQLPLFFFTKDTIYYSSILPDYFHNETDKGRIDAGKQESYKFIENEKYLLKHAHEFINAIIISDDQLETLEIAKKNLLTRDELTISSSFSNNIEIIPKAISKAIAIEELQKYYHISKEQTISFGDGGNDIDMLKASGISVAMENATEDVKKYASHLTTSNNDEGVYKFLKQFFIKEKKYGK